MSVSDTRAMTLNSVITSSAFDLLCVVVFLTAAMTYPFLKGETLRRSLVKTTPMVALALWAFAKGQGSASAIYALSPALLFSAAGDWFLSRPGTQNFLKGMIAFLCAHLIYCALFLLILSQSGVPSWPDPQHRAPVLVLALALLFGYPMVRAAGALRLPVTLYATVIAAMAALAMLLPRSPEGQVVSIGALVFVTSDLLIGQEVFLRKTFPGQGLIIWITYCAAQVLLTIGLLGILTAKG